MPQTICGQKCFGTNIFTRSRVSLTGRLGKELVCLPVLYVVSIFIGFYTANIISFRISQYPEALLFIFFSGFCGVHAEVFPIIESEVIK